MLGDNETVTAAVLGHDPGLPAGVLDLAPEPVDSGPQRGASTPPIGAVAERLEELVAAHRGPGLVGQQPQQPELPGREVQVPVAAPAQPRECVEKVVTTTWVTVHEKRKSRTIPPRPDKRIKIVPDKRVRTN